MRGLIAATPWSVAVSLLLPLMGGCPAANSGGLNDTSLSAASATDNTATDNTTADSQNALPAPATSIDTSKISPNADPALHAASVSATFPTCSLPADAGALADQVLNLVNQERANAGLNPVVANVTLENEADEYACELIGDNFFAHENPVTGSTLKDRAAAFNYQFSVIGENLAAGQKSPEEVMAAWMNSPGHRANILDPRFTQLGVAVRSGGQYGLYWVQEFGKPLN